MNRLKLEALISSILIYLIIIVTIFSIALYSPANIKPKTYVDKKSEIIEVSLGAPTKKQNYKTSINSKKEIKKDIVKKKKKKVVKKVRNIHKKSKKHPKKVVKKPSKKVTKKPSKKLTSTKKPSKPTQSASSLFKRLPKNIKNYQPSTQTSGKGGKSIKKANSGKGIENRYFAKVQSMLKGWPAQSNFAGERVKVELTIYPTGLFDYKVLYRSLNPEFNRALKAYLEQLKRVGFGPHSNPRPYKIIVEFIAKG